MGDIYEITTWPKHQNIFYKITSCAIVFYVKGFRDAAVGLAKIPGQCVYWVFLGYNEQCTIQAEGRQSCHVLSPGILSREKYRKFWISWFNGSLQFGRSNDKTPMLSQPLLINDLQYVTFSVLGEREAIQWKFHLPPQIPRPLLREIKGGEPHWVTADTQLPDGALIGGHENGVLYVIRAHHRRSLTPGKFVPNLGLGFIPWGGQSNEHSDFEVLCGYNCTWVQTRNNKIPVGAVEGGYSEDGHEILYVGRVMYQGHLIPGKVQPSHKTCYIPYNGREISNECYEILVRPHSKMANNYYSADIEIPDTASDIADIDNEIDEWALN